MVEATGMAGREYLFELSGAVRTQDGGTAHPDRPAARRLPDMERLCTELIDFTAV